LVNTAAGRFRGGSVTDDQRWRRAKYFVALDPIIIERLRRAVENDVVIGEPDRYRPAAVLNSSAVVAAHAVADVNLHGGERAFRLDAGLAVPRKYRAIDHRPAVVADRNAEIGVFNADIVENGINSQPRNRTAARINLDGGLSHVPYGCVGDEQLASAGALFGNAARRAAEIAVDQAVFYEDRAAGNDGSAGDPDSDQAGVDAIEIEVAQAHGFAHVGLCETVERDVDAVGPGVKDGSEHLVAIDGDRFGDRHRAEAAGVKAVDLAVDGGFGDGAGERLARRGATARIGIIAHSRDPGAGRLGVNGCGLQEEHERRRNERERSLTHGALRPERAAGGWRIRSATA
jgi:hypothetical protein